MKPAKQPLSAEETSRLRACEFVIHQGLQNFVDVGAALLEVSDRRLYRDTYSTFEDYCRDKWRMTASRAYQLCEAAEVIKEMPSESQNILRNDAQARAAKKAPREKRAQVVETAVAKAKGEGRTMTANDVKTAVLEVCEPSTGDNEGDHPPGPAEIPAPPTISDDFKKLGRQLEDITHQLQNWMALAGAATEKEKLCIRPVATVLKAQAVALFEWSKKTL